jgi:EmrB/QacA subfamily drug resistance transporter
MAAGHGDRVVQGDKPLTSRQTLPAAIGLCFVLMLVAVDQTVVGTALPTIVAELDGFSLYAWVGTAYLLTSVVTIPVFGRLGDFYGRKPFVVASVIVFVAASVFCSLSQTMLQLVIGRALQGIGGGMLVGTAFASVPDLFPDPRVRLRWQVLFSSAFGVANAFGPTLGGFLTQYAGWRSVFYVNLPIGAASLLFLWRYLPWIRQNRESSTGAMRLDWLGALLIALVLGCWQMFVEFVPRYGLSWIVIALGVSGVLLVMGLVYWEDRCAQPLLPMDMFRDRGLSALFLLSVISGFIMFALLFYLPLLLQGGFGLNPKQAGLLITPLVVCITLGSIINSRVVVRLLHGNYMLYVGFAFLSLACVGLLFVDTSTPDPEWRLIPYMVIAGLGLGVLMPNLTVFAQQLVGKTRFGIATAMLQSLRMVGGMVGAVVVGTLINHFYKVGVREMAAVQDDPGLLPMLADPQVLVSSELQSTFMAHLQRLSLHGDMLITAARDVLVGAIHIGLAAALFMALLGVLGVYRVPLITISRQTKAADMATDVDVQVKPKDPV